MRGTATGAVSTTTANRSRRTTASFEYSPAAPLVGQEVIFRSTAKDFEGQPNLAWDLDDATAFDDARAQPSASPIQRRGPSWFASE